MIMINNILVKQANLASKKDVANFVKRTDFDTKLKNVISNKNGLNELSKKLKQYQEKHSQIIW